MLYSGFSCSRRTSGDDTLFSGGRPHGSGNAASYFWVCLSGAPVLYPVWIYLEAARRTLEYKLFLHRAILVSVHGSVWGKPHAQFFFFSKPLSLAAFPFPLTFEFSVLGAFVID